MHSRFSKYQQWLRSAWFGTFASLLMLLTGVVGSLLSRSILSAEVVPLGLFVGLVLVTAFCLLWHRRAHEAARTEEIGRLESAHEQLPDLIRTMPDEEFMYRLGQIVESLLVVHQRNDDGKEAMLEVLGLSLNAVARLAQMFDGTEDSDFHSNVMLFVSGENAQAWKNHVLFKTEGMDLAALNGLLVLPYDLTATHDEMRDTTLHEIALPVPNDPGSAIEDGGSGWKVLPGAPFVCAIDTRFELFRSTKEIEDWCETQGDHTKDVKAQLKDYFTKARFNGLLSIPLYEPTEEFQEGGLPIAVLNIDWDKAYRLRRRESASLFVESIAPIRTILASRLVKLGEIAPPRPTLGKGVHGQAS